VQKEDGLVFLNGVGFISVALGQVLFADTVVTALAIGFNDEI